MTKFKLLALAATMVALFVFSPLGAGLSQAQDPAPVVTTDANSTTIVTEDTVTNVEAPSATTVVVPYGNALDALLENIFGLVGSAVTLVFAFLARNLPKQIVDFLIMIRAEQMLARAAEYGINATRGAVKDKSLSIDVGNEAIAKATNYVLDSAPGWLIKWLGGPSAVSEKMVARIPLDETVSR